MNAPLTLGVADAADTSELRRAVLRPQWPPGSTMSGDDDPHSIHIAARDHAGFVLGTCVLTEAAYPGRPDLSPAWQLRGMATAPQSRGLGIGAQVLAEAGRQVLARGAVLLWCHAREPAIAFYRRNGWIEDGPLFVHAETGIPHRRMYQELFAEPTASKQ